MEFKTPEFKRVYNLLSNNNILIKTFKEKNVFITLEDFYDTYGIDKVKGKEGLVDITNDEILEEITNLLLKNSEKILSTSVVELVKSNFLRKEIINIIGNSVDKIVFQQLFYTYKYSYSTCFFENNYKYFLPEYDIEQLEKNESANAFLLAIMKEFDKLSETMDTIPNFSTYEDIPFEYINYLTQLLGFEQQQFMISEDQKEHFKELARNIIDIYKIKGTKYSYQLFFNFLGFDINLKEYFFDRRMYYDVDGENLETKTNNKESHLYYLTENDPRYNIVDRFTVDETVNNNNIGTQRNIFEFSNYIKELKNYGNSSDRSIRVLLGYSDQYINENGEIATWEGPVYTYFRTNFITISPERTYTRKNMNINQSYQVSKLADFLTPIFIQKDIIVNVSRESNNERLFLNWGYDGFYMLDGEVWEDELKKDFVIDETSKNGMLKKVLKNGMTEEYRNSLGMKEYYVGKNATLSDIPKGTEFEVFKLPIGNKISNINTNKYWGIVRPLEWSASGKAYPFAKKLTNYKFDKVNVDGEVETIHRYDYPINKKESKKYRYFANKYNNIESTLYWPRDKEIANNSVASKFESINYVDLNGYDRYTIKDIRRKINETIKINWVTNKSIYDFLNPNSEQEEKNEAFFAKNWTEVSNNSWTLYKTFKDIYVRTAKDTNTGSTLKPFTAEEQIKEFAKKYNNIINYDYIKDEIVGNASITKMNFVKDGDMYKISSSDEKTDEIISNSYDNEVFLLVKNTNGYSMYISSIVDPEKITENDINKILKEGYPLPNGSKRSVFEEGKIRYDYFKEAINYYKNLKANSYLNQEIEYLWRPVPENINVKVSSSSHFENFKALYSSFGNYSKFISRDSSFTYNKRFTIDGYKVKYNTFFVEDENGGTKYIMKKVIGPKKTIFDRNSVLMDGISSKSLLEAKETLLNPSIGNFAYIKNVYYDSNKQLNYNKMETRGIYSIDDYIWNRQNHLLRYQYSNRSIGQLIYSTYDNKLYLLTGMGYSDGNNLFGVKEINYYGKLEIDYDNLKGTISEFDKFYQGYDEKEEEDNYILNNNSRHVVWEELGLDFQDMKRPIKQVTDKAINKEITKRLFNLALADSVLSFTNKELGFTKK